MLIKHTLCCNTRMLGTAIEDTAEPSLMARGHGEQDKMGRTQ